MMANTTSQSIKVFIGAILLLLSTACSNENEPQMQTSDPDEGREQSIVDINLSFGDSWDIDFDETRAAPPSSSTVDNSGSYDDIANIDFVKVYTFRRKEGSDGEFYRDKTNEKTLPVIKNDTIHSTHNNSKSHPHNIARGTLIKTYGYEYRVISIAYPLRTQSAFSNHAPKFPEYNDSVMTITADTYTGFCTKMKILNCSDWSEYLTCTDYNGPHINHINEAILHTPQLFHSTLHSQCSDSDIISYAEMDSAGNLNSKVGLTGILKRGVAKVNIRVPSNNVNNGIEWLTVLASTPYTKVGLKSYDDFLNPSDSIDLKCPKNPKTENQYTAVSHIRIEGSLGANEYLPVTFYILPGKTKLALRIKKSEKSIYWTTTSIENGQLTGDGFEIHGNNGTGIISPDLIEDVFYFRRNHKYTITINDPEKVLKEHSLN